MTMHWALPALLIVHFLGDFVLQTHWQASNKSTRLDALASHVGTYTGCLALGSLALFGPSVETAAFVLGNGVLHFVTDFGTSRLSSRMWKQERWHDFFVVIGADQLIHQLTLAATLVVMGWTVLP